jgi:hypothetical protein
MNRATIDPGEASLLYLDMQLSAVKYISEYTLHVRFTDGTEGTVSLDELVGKGVFASLKDRTIFSKAYSTGHSIAWSDDMEIDSDRIYMELTDKAHATD